MRFRPARPRVVVTFPAGGADRERLRTELDGSDVVFLDGLSNAERGTALREAVAALAWRWGVEIRPEEDALLERLRFVQLISAGVDGLPFERLPANVAVAGNVGAYAEPMAEHVVAMIFAAAKRLLVRHAEMARGEFHSFLPNRMVRGMTVGVLGLGGIGVATARLLRPLGVAIHAINTSGSTEEPVEFIGTLDHLDGVLRDCDAVVVSLPLSRRTHGLLGHRELALMKSDAILVNVARAEIVDESALYEHLRTHAEFTAALDVWWNEPGPQGGFSTRHPFFDLPNVIGSPHNSAIVPGIVEEAARRAAANIARFLRGERPAGLVRRDDYVG